MASEVPVRGAGTWESMCLKRGAERQGEADPLPKARCGCSRTRVGAMGTTSEGEPPMRAPPRPETARRDARSCRVSRRPAGRVD